MKYFLILLAGISTYAGDLIYLSSDITPANLEALSGKYQQMLVVEDNGVYLVPSECRSERYFGGASEGVLNLVRGPIRTETVPNTQEVFEAKEEKQIVNKIELDKTFAVAEGKISKDFLEDKEGRGFGGASEVSLMIHNEIEPVVSKVALKAQVKLSQRPSCQILMDGSGYKFDALNNGRLYINGKITPMHNDMVSFQ
ncbi:MAG: hypothetical protein PHV62_06215 [Sulfuricurvum sp.]|nr:hypothetical protein [Sulfuricurvum sp.]